jgi:hypothetical protein
LEKTYRILVGFQRAGANFRVAVFLPAILQARTH